VSSPAAGRSPLRADLERGGGGPALPGRAVGSLAVAILLLHAYCGRGNRLGRLAHREPGARRASRSRRGALGEPAAHRPGRHEQGGRGRPDREDDPLGIRSLDGDR